MNRDEALATADRLYAAATGETDWGEALLMLTDRLGSIAASLEIHDVIAGRLLDLRSTRLDPRDLVEYARDYADGNPRVGFLRGRNIPISFDHLFLTEREMDRDPFYADYLAPKGLRYFVSVQTPLIDGRVKGVVAVQRSGRARGADMECVKQVALLRPHIVRALRLYWHRVRDGVDPGRFDRVLAGFGLTPAERRLATALKLGEPPAEYARRNKLSLNTVHTHYRRLKSKLDCASQPALLARLHGMGGSGKKIGMLSPAAAVSAEPHPPRELAGHL